MDKDIVCSHKKLWAIRVIRLNKKTHAFIVAPAKSQAAKNSKDKIIEIFQHWPLLKREIVGGDISDLPGLYGKDYITLNFRNESVLDVVGALDSTRGGRRHCGLIDEVRRKVIQNL